MSRPDPHVAHFRYPERWPEIADEVRGRAGARCECQGECSNPFCTSSQQTDGRCIMQEQRHFPRHSVVPLDHNPSNAGALWVRENLRAFCPACCDAYRYDLHHRPHEDPPAHQLPAQIGLAL